jgi:hypothetical protein
MAMISGARGTANITQTTRKVDMPDRIFLLEPDAAPLTLILKMAAKKVAINPEFGWHEDELCPRWDAVNYSTGYTTSETSIVVDNGSYFQAGDLAKNATSGEVLRVSSVSTNTLVVQRAFGETAAGAIADNAKLLIVGNAIEEGAAVPTARSTKKVRAYNFTQIFRDTVSVTGTEEASEIYGGKDRAYQQMKKGIEHKVNIEEAFLFGERKEDTTSGTHAQRATRGCMKFISTNTTDAGNTLTETEFNTFIESIFRYGKKKKLLLCCSKVLSAIDSWARSALKVVPSDKVYGISVKQYLTSHGMLNVVKDDLFEQGYNERAFALEMSELAFRYMQRRDTKLLKDVVKTGVDGWTDEWRTECGLEFKSEKKHGMLYNVDTYS